MITLEDLPFAAAHIWNAGVARFRDEYLLLITVGGLEGLFRIYLASSRDGRDFQINPEPFMQASAQGLFAPYEEFGIRDPRITQVDGTFYITYVADSPHGLRIGLARTDDFQSAEKIGLITEPDNKNGALFPRKIGGMYAMLERPFAGDSIWISYSDDLTYWGSSTVVMTPRGRLLGPHADRCRSPSHRDRTRVASALLW